MDGLDVLGVLIVFGLEAGEDGVEAFSAGFAAAFKTGEAGDDFSGLAAVVGLAFDVGASDFTLFFLAAKVTGNTVSDFFNELDD